jgi:putative copper resistance protein D
LELAGLLAWLVLALVAWPGASFNGARGGLTMAGLLAVAWSRSAVSHAANAGDFAIDVAVDMLHLFAACMWVGVVWMGAGLRLPMADAAAQDRAAASAWVSSLSSTATAALAIVVATGVFKVWRTVDDWTGFGSSDYGHALSAKLGLVAAAVALGAYNRFKVLPAVLADLRHSQEHGDRQRWRRRLLRVLRIEAVVLCLVLAAAVVLASTEPPRNIALGAQLSTCSRSSR